MLWAASDSNSATGSDNQWGLGEETQPGFPLRQGFDYFFGYLSQVHADNYFPEYLIRNNQRVPLRNEVELPPGKQPGFLGGTATKRVDYSHDLFAEDALKFVQDHAAGPFFLYLALTIPHANNEATRRGQSRFGTLQTKWAIAGYQACIN